MESLFTFCSDENKNDKSKRRILEKLIFDLFRVTDDGIDIDHTSKLIVNEV
jgi:hypothetical protein